MMMIMMTMECTKNFKTIDGRIIVCTVTENEIIMNCNVFVAKYKHTEVNMLIGLHSSIMTEKTLKEVNKFINESREPEQLSLF